jgi:hypothetical protein
LRGSDSTAAEGGSQPIDPHRVGLQIGNPAVSAENHLPSTASTSTDIDPLRDKSASTDLVVTRQFAAFTAEFRLSRQRCTQNHGLVWAVNFLTNQKE